MFKRLVMAALLAWAGVFLAAGEAINIDEANPPFMYAKGQQAAGLYAAIADAAFRRMGVDVTVTPLPWKRVIEAIDEGRAGVIGLYRNAQRERKYDFSAPVFTERVLVCFNKAEPVAASRVADLKGRKVGVILGWSYGDEFDQARRAGLFTVEEVGSDQQNLQKLQLRRLDAVLIIAEAAAGLESRFPGLAVSPRPLFQNPTYLAFNKQAGKTALLKRFDAALESLRKSGEFGRLVQSELGR